MRKQCNRTAVNPFLPPATKLRQGNIFTGICQTFCSQGGVSVQEGLCPGRSLSGGSLSRGSLSGGFLSGRPPTETPLYGNERMVRILLECILVNSTKTAMIPVHKNGFNKNRSQNYCFTQQWLSQSNYLDFLVGYSFNLHALRVCVYFFHLER